MSTVSRLIFGDKRDPREELVEIFGGPDPHGGGAPTAALAWAHDQLDVASITEVQAIRILRRAEPRLGLSSATYLAGRIFR